jgi:translation initiation factor IF-3
VRIAEERETDLVEVAPLAKPPVCKLMDFGTYLYNLKKKDKKQKKNVKRTETKTIRLSMRTDTHDLEIKAAKARKFLEGRNLVKVALIFRGRELSHQDLGRKKMDQFYELIEDISAIEQQPKRLGHQMIMMLKPI